MEATYIDLPSRRISVADLPQHVRDRLMAIEQKNSLENERVIVSLPLSSLRIGI